MSAIAKARQSLTMDGYPDLAPLVHGDDKVVVRPCRGLDREEAVAVIRAWRAAYAHLPLCSCPEDPTAPCPIDAECRANDDDERRVHDLVKSLAQPLDRHLHYEGEVCSWPDTWAGVHA